MWKRTQPKNRSVQLRIADFKCGLKIASEKSNGNSFVNRRSVFYWLIGIVIATIAIAFAFHFDEAIRDFIAQHQNRTVKVFMRNVSRLGDWTEHFAVGAGLLGIAWWRGSKKWMRVFLSMLLALALAGAAARVVKIGVGRARPSLKAEQVWNGVKFSSKYHAFPSGHVAASTAFFAVLVIASWRIGLAFLPIPIAIGLSRMYVAAHYLSDVVCAAILGILCAILVAHFALRSISNQQSAISN
jgi:membrane-associated phospholipid phosphatase